MPQSYQSRFNPNTSPKQNQEDIENNIKEINRILDLTPANHTYPIGFSMLTQFIKECDRDFLYKNNQIIIEFLKAWRAAQYEITNDSKETINQEIATMYTNILQIQNIMEASKIDKKSEIDKQIYFFIDYISKLTPLLKDLIPQKPPYFQSPDIWGANQNPVELSSDPTLQQFTVSNTRGNESRGRITSPKLRRNKLGAIPPQEYSPLTSQDELQANKGLSQSTPLEITKFDDLNSQPQDHFLTQTNDFRFPWPVELDQEQSPRAEFTQDQTSIATEQSDQVFSTETQNPAESSITSPRNPFENSASTSYTSSSFQHLFPLPKRIDLGELYELGNDEKTNSREQQEINNSPANFISSQSKQAQYPLPNEIGQNNGIYYNPPIPLSNEIDQHVGKFPLPVQSTTGIDRTFDRTNIESIPPSNETTFPSPIRQDDENPQNEYEVTEIKSSITIGNRQNDQYSVDQNTIQDGSKTANELQIAKNNKPNNQLTEDNHENKSSTDNDKFKPKKSADNKEKSTKENSFGGNSFSNLFMRMFTRSNYLPKTNITSTIANTIRNVSKYVFK